MEFVMGTLENKIIDAFGINDKQAKFKFEPDNDDGYPSLFIYYRESGEWLAVELKIINRGDWMRERFAK